MATRNFEVGKRIFHTASGKFGTLRNIHIRGRFREIVRLIVEFDDGTSGTFSPPEILTAGREVREAHIRLVEEDEDNSEEEIEC